MTKPSDTTVEIPGGVRGPAAGHAPAAGPAVQIEADGVGAVAGPRDATPAAERAGPGSVRFTVLRNVLLMQEFEVDDIVRTTGLNRNSVWNVIRSFKEDGLLTKLTEQEVPAGQSQSTRPPGRRPGRYRVVPRSIDRLRAQWGLEAGATKPVIAEKLDDKIRVRIDADPTAVPDSRAYREAIELIEQAEGLAPGDSGRTPLLDQAGALLQSAADQEGGEYAPEPIRNRLNATTTRLEGLRGSPRAAATAGAPADTAATADTEWEQLVRSVGKVLGDECLKRLWDELSPEEAEVATGAADEVMTRLAAQAGRPDGLPAVFTDAIRHALQLGASIGIRRAAPEVWRGVHAGAVVPVRKRSQQELELDESLNRSTEQPKRPPGILKALSSGYLVPMPFTSSQDWYPLPHDLEELRPDPATDNRLLGA